jgi:hypothetical protein
MKTINDLFDLIKQSDMTLIGYTFKDERVKDELISNFNYIDVGYIDSSFSLKSFLRDIKLDFILNGEIKTFDYIVIDISNVNFFNNDISKASGMMKFVEKLRSETYSDYGNYPQKNVKIILTSPLNRSINTSSSLSASFTGGSGLLYASDLVLTIDGYKVKIQKNRFGGEKDEFNLNTKQIVEF